MNLILETRRKSLKQNFRLCFFIAISFGGKQFLSGFKPYSNRSTNKYQCMLSKPGGGTGKHFWAMQPKKWGDWFFQKSLRKSITNSTESPLHQSLLRRIGELWRAVAHLFLKGTGTRGYNWLKVVRYDGSWLGESPADIQTFFNCLFNFRYNWWILFRLARKAFKCAKSFWKLAR